MIAAGDDSEDQIIEIGVANVGARAVVITNVLWKWGIFRRQYAVQVTGSAMDSLRIHQRLEPGHQGSFYIDLDPDDDDNWIRRFSKNVPAHFGRLWLRKLRIGISTAVGVTVWAPVEKGLQEKLLEAATQAKATSAN